MIKKMCGDFVVYVRRLVHEIERTKHIFIADLIKHFLPKFSIYDFK